MILTNIFRIFDPSSRINFSLNWIRILLIFFLFPFQFWLIPSRFIKIWNLTINSIFNEFKVLISYSYSNIIIFITLFFLILFNNFLGLFPYIFTASRHIRFRISLSLTFWLRIIFYGWFNFINDIFTHLTPIGTPKLLIPFIVLIELIRLIIRPITLSIRLTANIIAGHLLLYLLGSSAPSISKLNIIFIFLIIRQLLLIILEIRVSLIQAYVFSILTTLYRKEI